MSSDYERLLDDDLGRRYLDRVTRPIDHLTPEDERVLRSLLDSPGDIIVIRNLTDEAMDIVAEALQPYDKENPAFAVGVAPMPDGSAGLAVAVYLPSLVIGEYVTAVIPVGGPKYVEALAMAVPQAVEALLKERTKMAGGAVNGNGQ